MINNLKALFMIAPPHELDPALLPLVQKWEDDPTAIQVLEVLDHCICYAQGSGFVVSSLQQMLSARLEREKTTLEQLLPQATWRQQMDNL